MKKYLKVAGMMFVCGFFCQAQIIAVPIRSKTPTSQKTKSGKKRSANIPMPSGIANRSDAEEHKIASTGHAAFDEFRNQIMGDLNDFRKTIIDHYADFLEGEWHEFEPLKRNHRFTKPKPETLTDAAGNEVKKVDQAVLDAGARKSWKDAGRERPIVPETEIETPEISMDSKTTNVWGIMDSKALDKTLSNKKVKDVVKDIEHGAAALTRDTPGDWLDFFELDVRVPAIDFSFPNELNPNNLSLETSKMWRQLQEDGVAERVLPELNKIAERMKLNDYLKYVLVTKYVDSKFPDASRLSKTVAMHYLLTNMGYCIRLGYAPGSDHPFLMLPSDQQIYEHPMLTFNDNTYYLFSPFNDADFHDEETTAGWRILTCSLPVEAEYGEKVKFDLSGLNLPYIPMEYSIEYDGIKLEGEVNEAMFPILAEYPQMTTDRYAASFVSPEVRADLVRQIKEQLGHLPKREAINRLLSFIQHGFDYATDQQYHGYEKPYFVEENLYYPINDCEDRAILFTYLAWNALGVENQLIAYPDHEAAAVSGMALGEFDEDYVSQLARHNPTGYSYHGEEFYISDPTYIGGKAGDCMPVYVSTFPQIDRHYTTDK